MNPTPAKTPRATSTSLLNSSMVGDYTTSLSSLFQCLNHPLSGEIFMNHSPESAVAVSQFSSQIKVNLLKNFQ